MEGRHGMGWEGASRMRWCGLLDICTLYLAIATASENNSAYLNIPVTCSLCI